MRALDVGLAAHIAQGETTLCHCWKITRGDGVVLGFTDHDRALSFGGTGFVPAYGLDGGEVPAKLGAQVKTSEVLGVLHAEAITEDDILLGRYDGAVVETWRVNWGDVSQRLLLRSDAIGEIVREDGVFRAELRSAQVGLNATHGRIYQGLCDASLGDARCKVNLANPAYQGFATVIATDDPFRLVVDGLSGFAPEWFAFGQALWTDGRRDGLRDGVMSHSRIGSADVLGFSARVGDWVVPGDTLTVTAGCDRRFATCKAKFANAVNFRGFPHIPGSDYVLRHPRNGDAMDGRAVVK
ncbi:hypothetical protein WH87_06720 [Devosia epidermidihirudinis]|uniref:Bacteriophage phiJL001 Gp84 C-terminal domain-containing protein n=1 Tax=Devosia epidermidihirudinis TaxID=1293439 RepID=A0A0F5QGD6_9HYPH|nr:DUF2163 domain-containing protein [Devosia epidermidihirudinis]KKC39811.1 hypothetical protein WH87_06720 [Devosia epidermidihirudinis]